MKKMRNVKNWKIHKIEYKVVVIDTSSQFNIWQIMEVVILLKKIYFLGGKGKWKQNVQYVVKK